MKKLLLNDTSAYHVGCAKVVERLEQEYGGFDRKIRTLDRSMTETNFSEYDLVIINGEGSLHHNTRTAHRLMESMKLAIQADCLVRLTNTVWQGMSNEWDNYLHQCECIFTREVHSRDNLVNNHSCPSNLVGVMPDRSYFVDVPLREYPHVRVYEGQYIKRVQEKFVNSKYPRINIFQQSWEEIVNRLRNCDLLITGRHHEMYAACVAECRFIARPGNTWKNEGLLASAKVHIPDEPKGVLEGKYDAEYEKLWSYLRYFKQEN